MSLSLFNKEDSSYFPSVQLSLVMVRVMLITFPPMTVKYKRHNHDSISVCRGMREKAEHTV